MGEESSTVELVKAVSSLDAKMDMVIANQQAMQSNLSGNYMPRQEIESRMERQGERTGRLESRVRDLEAAPHKYLSTIISILGVAIALFGALHH